MSIAIKRVLCGMIQENAYIVRAEGRDDCVVVDPGDEYPKLLRAIGDLRVGAVLLFNFDSDMILDLVRCVYRQGHLLLLLPLGPLVVRSLLQRRRP